MKSAVVVGNPKPASRTLAAATYVAGERCRGGRPTSWSTWPRSGPGCSTGRTPVMAGLVSEVGAADLVVVASPTYKATYTGLLKLFLDRFSTDGLRGVAVPLMLGAGPAHALAPECAAAAARGDRRHHGPRPIRAGRQPDNPAAYADWLARVRPVVAAQAGALA